MELAEDVQRLIETLADLDVPEQTLNTARGALGANPGDPGQWAELAAHLRENGAGVAALSTYAAALRRFPEHPMLLNNCGFALLHSRQAAVALGYFDRAIAARPDYVSAIEHRANALEQLERYAEAAAQYRVALELAPDSARSWNSLGVCERNLGNQELATECFQRASEHDGAFGDPLFNLMMVARDAGRNGEAVAYARRLLAVNPFDRDAVRVIDELGG